MRFSIWRSSCQLSICANLLILRSILAFKSALWGIFLEKMERGISTALNVQSEANWALWWLYMKELGREQWNAKKYNCGQFFWFFFESGDTLDSADGWFTCHPSNIAPLVVTVCLSPRENVHDSGGLWMVTFNDVSFIEYSVVPWALSKLVLVRTVSYFHFLAVLKLTQIRLR